MDIEGVLGKLSLEEKCDLLGGASTWRTLAIPRVGLPALKVSDGPNGVRGEGHGADRTPGVVIPAGICLGASWDPALAEKLGQLLGREARRKRVHVVLGPTVNLQRTPIGGRTFECYSEDPELSAALGVGWIRGVQSEDVAVTVKHFVANDTEVERMHVDVQVDERSLRELYLRPFEAAVHEGKAWGVMSAYNKLGGEHCAENERLLTRILRQDWGFDGFVVSDWFGAHDTLGAARAGLSLEMPGPPRIYGAPLAKAVQEGSVDTELVDRCVRDLLLLTQRVRAEERPVDGEEGSLDDPADRALCRRAAAAGTVLLRNDGLLPLDARTPTLALVGPNAVIDRSMGGGSASLEPLRSRTLAEALEARFAGRLEVEPGVRTDKLTPLVGASQLRTPDGEPGLRVRYARGSDPRGPVQLETRTPSSLLRFFGSTPPGLDGRNFSLQLDGVYVPEVDGPHQIGVVTTGPTWVRFGERDVVDDPRGELPRSSAFFGFGSEEVIETLELRAGVPVAIEAGWSGRHGFGVLRIGIAPVEPPDLLERAVRAAAAADVAVVMVGTTDEWETEGEDRTTMALPGRQDELVSAVRAANPRTLVIVNAGSPVTMPWVDDVPAILVPFFAGIEQADALVDLLFGEADPGGRLPITFPRRLEECPSWAHYAPKDGVQRYDEGLNVGYRGYEASDTEPLFPFGHGLSYGEIEWGTPILSSRRAKAGERVSVEVPLRNTGSRPGTAVVQGYVAAPDAAVPRAPRALASWHKLELAPGASATARLEFGEIAFRRFDPERGVSGQWIIDPGRYELIVAASARDERARLAIELV